MVWITQCDVANGVLFSQNIVEWKLVNCDKFYNNLIACMMLSFAEGIKVDKLLAKKEKNFDN